METKEVPHIYAEITTISSSRRGDYTFTLSNSGFFQLPPSALSDARMIQRGDMALIDLKYWEVEETGHVFIYRRGTDLPGMNQVTEFGIRGDTALFFPEK